VNSVEVPGKLTAVTETDALGMDKLTTSTKSLADYFKEKLNARMGNSSGTSNPTAARADADDAYDTPRGGIGASRMHLEIQSETKIEEETQRVGLSKFSSLMSSSFLAATSSVSYVPQDEEPLDKIEGVADISDVDSGAETKGKSKKEKKRKEKKMSEGTSENEDDQVERKEKKSKKDKKGKGKAIEGIEEEVDVDAREDEKKGRKKDKNEKKKKAVEAAPKAEATEDNVEESSRKKEKKKHKLEKSDAMSAELEDSGKSKKEKKRYRTDS
jgi:Pin2-interacting protein X1